MSTTAAARADELEVKARVEDPDGVRAALVRAGAALAFRGDMLDRRFVTILERLGFAVSVRIDRRVEVYRLRHAILRLEWYPAMDVLLEVEGEPDDIERAIVATALPRDCFLAESLPYFVAAYERRTGQAAVLAR